MSIMAKTPSGYKKIGSAYLGERPVDKVYNANGDVVYALQRELTGVPPLLFKGKEQSELLNYRIYGDTVDGESVGDRTANLFDFGEWSKNIKANVDNSLVKGIDGITITANSNDAFTAPYAYTHESVYKIYVKPNTNYLLSWTSNNDLSGRVFIFKNGMVDGTRKVSTDNSTTKYLLFGTDADTEFITLRFGVTTAGNTITYSKIMLNEGSTALPYEPYGYKVPVTVEGKNILQNTATSQTIKGVTFTINSDGSIVCDGQASQNTVTLVYSNFLVPSGTYILTGCPNGGSESKTYKMLLFLNGEWLANDTGSGVVFTLTKTSTVSARIDIYNGYTCNNLTFYPMIRKAGIEDKTYEPYHAPVTVPIYLPEPIKMVGDEAEYIDYAEQKQHRVRVNYLQSSDFECGAIYTGEPYKNLSYQNSKTPAGFLDFDSTRKRFTDLITIIGTYTISIADGWEFGIVMFPDNKNFGVTMTYYTAPVTISDCTFAIQIRKTDISDISSADISDYKIMLNKGAAPLPYEPYIENTEVDVTLPALPTIKGTNTMSVDTAVQPSRMDIKGRIKSLT